VSRAAGIGCATASQSRGLTPDLPGKPGDGRHGRRPFGLRSTLNRPQPNPSTVSHGVFAPHSRWRAEVTPAGRGKATTTDLRTPAERHRAMTWAQRLKRVFGIEIRGSCRPGRGRRRGARLRGSWGCRNGVGRRGPGRVHDAGVAACAGGGLRCTNPGIAGRFSSPWTRSAGGQQAQRPWRPGFRAGRLQHCGCLNFLIPRRSRLGTDSSSSSRIDCQALPRRLKHCDRLFSRYGGKVFEEIVE